MLKPTSARQGFTLLELLIVSVIMLVVAGGSIAALTTFQERQKALVAAKTVQQMMWSAQTKARVRETPAGCNPLNGYRVVVSANQATLHPICNGSPGSSRQDYRYPSGVTASSTVTLYFLTLEGGVTNSLSTTPPVTTIWQPTFSSTGGPTFSFTITPLGAISNVQSSEGSANDL